MKMVAHSPWIPVVYILIPAHTLSLKGFKFHVYADPENSSYIGYVRASVGRRIYGAKFTMKPMNVDVQHCFYEQQWFSIVDTIHKRLSDPFIRCMYETRADAGLGIDETGAIVIDITT